MLSSSTIRLVCHWTSCRTRPATRESRSTELDLIMRWRSRSRVRAPPGKARLSRLPILHTSSFRNLSSRATGRRGLTAAKCWPLSITGRGRGNSRLAKRARSFWITRRFTPRLVGKLATADGSTPTITTPSPPTRRGGFRSELKAGEEGEVILDHTPFYAEAGGQVGDRGWFYSDDHNTVAADVKGCYYPIQGVRAHQVIAKQPIRVGDKVDAVVNTDIRQATMRNHTATHLLHAGLREVLGKHVKQAGSLVAPGHLRFDFSHFTAVEDE